MCRPPERAAYAELNEFFKIVKSFVFPVPAHGGREHFYRGGIFFEALGKYPAKMELVKPPFSDGGKGFRTVTVSGISWSDTASQFRAAPAVEVVEDGFTDKFSIQPNGKICSETVCKIPLGDVKKAAFLNRTA